MFTIMQDSYVNMQHVDMQEKNCNQVRVLKKNKISSLSKCKMLLIYVEMPLIYVDMQLIHIDMQISHVDMREKYVDMQLFFISTCN